MKKDNRDIELQSRITFKMVHEKQIDVYRNGFKVGEIWSWKPEIDVHNESHYPYNEKEEEYTEKNGIQICGFSEISEVWNCHAFNNKKDVVVTFNGL
jgi:hypothetical protein